MYASRTSHQAFATFSHWVHDPERDQASTLQLAVAQFYNVTTASTCISHGSHQLAAMLNTLLVTTLPAQKCAMSLGS